MTCARIEAKVKFSLLRLCYDAYRPMPFIISKQNMQKDCSEKGSKHAAGWLFQIIMLESKIYRSSEPHLFYLEFSRKF